MENKSCSDDYIKNELQKTSSPPEYINRNLISSCRSKEEFKTVNSIFFILLLIQSLFILLVGLVLLSDIFLKMIIIGFGVLLFKISSFIYNLTISKESVLI